MILRRPGRYKAVYIILRTHMENKNLKLVRKISMLKTAAAKIFGQEFHKKGLPDFSPTIL